MNIQVVHDIVDDLREQQQEATADEGQYGKRHVEESRDGNVHSVRCETCGRYIKWLRRSVGLDRAFTRIAVLVAEYFNFRRDRLFSPSCKTIYIQINLAATSYLNRPSSVVV